MNVEGFKRVIDFADRNPDVRQPALAWRSEVEDAEWKSPHDVRERYPNASFIGDGRVVFNLRGNRFRLDVKISYKNNTVLVVRIGTHADYDRWEF